MATTHMGKATQRISSHTRVSVFFVGSRYETEETRNKALLYSRFLVVTAVRLRFPFFWTMTPSHWVFLSGTEI
jgi:hypothetical protein